MFSLCIPAASTRLHVLFRLDQQPAAPITAAAAFEQPAHAHAAERGVRAWFAADGNSALDYSSLTQTELKAESVNTGARAHDGERETRLQCAAHGY